MLVIAYATAPFVTYMHLKLPHFARRSRDHLMRWVEKIPSDTEIDITMIGFFGWPRVYRMPFSQLRRVRLTLSAANIKRVGMSSALNSKRPWWRGKIPTLFYVGTDRAQKVSVWPKLVQQVKVA